MKPEPLKGKITSVGEQGTSFIWVNDIKSAVEGLIGFHEDRIEELIKSLEGGIGNRNNIRSLFVKIHAEYKSIMAIEYWLEDVI